MHYGLVTVIALVPPKLELPLTVFTVKRTDPTALRISVREIVHCPSDPVEQDPVPVAPLLHVPTTLAPGSGEPLEVRVMRTLAVQRGPVVALEPASATSGWTTAAVTMTTADVPLVAPWSS